METNQHRMRERVHDHAKPSQKAGGDANRSPALSPKMNRSFLMPSPSNLPPKTCPFCHQAFTPQSSAQTICGSAECRKARDNARSQRWHDRRKAAAAQEARP